MTEPYVDESKLFTAVLADAIRRFGPIDQTNAPMVAEWVQERMRALRIVQPDELKSNSEHIRDESERKP